MVQLFGGDFTDGIASFIVMVNLTRIATKVNVATPFSYVASMGFFSYSSYSKLPILNSTNGIYEQITKHLTHQYSTPVYS